MPRRPGGGGVLVLVGLGSGGRRLAMSGWAMHPAGVGRFGGGGAGVRREEVRREGRARTPQA